MHGVDNPNFCLNIMLNRMNGRKGIILLGFKEGVIPNLPILTSFNPLSPLRLTIVLPFIF
jgi:hypothetical protein